MTEDNVITRNNSHTTLPCGTILYVNQPAGDPNLTVYKQYMGFFTCLLNATTMKGGPEKKALKKLLSCSSLTQADRRTIGRFICWLEGSALDALRKLKYDANEAEHFSFDTLDSIQEFAEDRSLVAMGRRGGAYAWVEWSLHDRSYLSESEVAAFEDAAFGPSKPRDCVVKLDTDVDMGTTVDVTLHRVLVKYHGVKK